MSVWARSWRAILCVLTAFVAGCDQEATNAPQGKAQTRIVFVTDWKAQAEHGGFYQALAEGLYAKRGLDVRDHAGRASGERAADCWPAAPPISAWARTASFRSTWSSEGVTVRAVMAVFQKDPQVLITHPRDDIKSLADMKGKPILISDAATTTFWPWLKAKFGFADTQIRKYTFNLAPFLVDPERDPGRLSHQSSPTRSRRKANSSRRSILLADNGYPGYANMVLVPQKWIDEQARKPCRRSSTPRIEGWMHYLYGDPSARERADQAGQSGDDRRPDRPGDRQDEVLRRGTVG